MSRIGTPINHKGNAAKERERIREERLKVWFQKRLDASDQRAENDKKARDAWRFQLQQRAAKRQHKFERIQEELPMRIEKMKAKKRRLDAIVRKYAMRWLNRVRARKDRIRDEKHESFWYSAHKDELKDCLDSLYTSSGKEKLDDVVMNIMKFKEALKKQIELDEKEENEEE